MNLKIRCSSLGDIMTKPKAKGETLSVGAKTYVEKAAKRFVYNYETIVSTREMTKGTIVEPESIALLNEILFTSYTKNEERRENNWICGTPDIIGPKHGYDIKSPWSLETFPATAEDAYDKGYEWQARGYMMLWDLDHYEIAHCLVDTPDELISAWDNVAVHKVSHIDPSLRLTRVIIERDRSLDEEIISRAEAAHKYFHEAVANILAQHNQ